MSPHGAVTQKRIPLNRIFSSRIMLDNLFVLFFSKNVARNRRLVLLFLAVRWFDSQRQMAAHTRLNTFFAHSSSHESNIAAIFFSQVHMVNSHVFSFGATFFTQFIDISNTASVLHLYITKNGYIFMYLYSIGILSQRPGSSDLCVCNLIKWCMNISATYICLRHSGLI